MNDLIKKTFILKGLTCTACETRIENKLTQLAGVKEVHVSFVTELLKISYNPKHISLEKISQTLEAMDYSIAGEPNNQKSHQEPKANTDKLSAIHLILIGIILLSIYFIIQQTIGFNFIPEVSNNMSLGVLFIVGFLTSLHCIAMCGGINLSQSITRITNTDTKASNRCTKLRPSLLYNGGRVISYTLIGGIVGTLGSVISISGGGKALISIFAGIFMVIMGLNLMNLFPSLRKFMPRIPKIFTKKITKKKNNKGPLVVGLLNGFMPCGPLQAMQLYALSTGSFYQGALAMFLFSAGTIPLMFGFGAISSLLTAKFTKKMLQISAILVILLGLIMVNRGLSLSGFSIQSITSQFISANVPKDAVVATINGNIQEVTIQLQSGSYQPIAVKAGIPVKWTIQAEEQNLNGCNNAIIIPEYGIEVPLQVGANTIEFTPEKSGTFTYTCWMGMISSQITVTQ